MLPLPLRQAQDQLEHGVRPLNGRVRSGRDRLPAGSYIGAPHIGVGIGVVLRETDTTRHIEQMPHRRAAVGCGR